MSDHLVVSIIYIFEFVLKSPFVTASPVAALSASQREHFANRFNFLTLM